MNPFHDSHWIYIIRQPRPERWLGQYCTCLKNIRALAKPHEPTFTNKQWLGILESHSLESEGRCLTRLTANQSTLRSGGDPASKSSELSSCLCKHTWTHTCKHTQKEHENHGPNVRAPEAQEGPGRDCEAEGRTRLYCEEAQAVGLLSFSGCESL